MWAGPRFDHVLPVRRGQKQYRHDALGSVIKLNHHAEPLPAAAPSGYRELIIASEGVEKPRSMVDPDGNRVRLVPRGHDGICQLAIRMRVRSLSEHRRFYGDILGFAEQSWSDGLAFRLGDSLLLLEEDRAATVDPARQALGWRYITLQIADIDTVHNDLRSKGVREVLRGNTWKRGADINDPRPGRQLDRAIPPGLDRRQSVLNNAAGIGSSNFHDQSAVIPSPAHVAGAA